MSMSTMTPGGELMIPNGWAGQIDDAPSLNSNRPLTNKATTEALQTIDRDIQQLLQLRSTLLQYGLSKICPTDLVTATEDNGLVLGAKEKNPGVNGTLANKLFSIIEESKIKMWNLRHFSQSNHDTFTPEEDGTYMIMCNGITIGNGESYMDIFVGSSRVHRSYFRGSAVTTLTCNTIAKITKGTVVSFVLYNMSEKTDSGQYCKIVKLGSY